MAVSGVSCKGVSVKRSGCSSIFSLCGEIGALLIEEGVFACLLLRLRSILRNDVFIKQRMGFSDIVHDLAPASLILQCR